MQNSMTLLELHPLDRISDIGGICELWFRVEGNGPSENPDHTAAHSGRWRDGCVDDKVKVVSLTQSAAEDGGGWLV